MRCGTKKNRKSWFLAKLEANRVQLVQLVVAAEAVGRRVHPLRSEILIETVAAAHFSIFRWRRRYSSHRWPSCWEPGYPKREKIVPNNLPGSCPTLEAKEASLSRSASWVHPIQGVRYKITLSLTVNRSEVTTLQFPLFKYLQ